MGISQQEDVHRPEIPLGKTREIDNKARISKKAEMKRKLNRNQKRITLLDIQLSSLTSLFVMNVKWLLNQQRIKIQLSQKHFFGKILNSMVKNMGFESWKYCAPRRNRLLGRTTKQQLRPKTLKILATLLAEA